jgi:hypothetical protein
MAELAAIYRAEESNSAKRISLYHSDLRYVLRHYSPQIMHPRPPQQVANGILKTRTASSYSRK